MQSHGMCHFFVLLDNDTLTKSAKVVAIDYVADESGQLVLDWNSLDSNTAIIERWPDKIREALGRLDV